MPLPEYRPVRYWLAPFHLDYCFVPEAWVDRLTGVEVGSFAAWPQSDHRPLTVDIDDE